MDGELARRQLAVFVLEDASTVPSILKAVVCISLMTTTRQYHILPQAAYMCMGKHSAVTKDFHICHLKDFTDGYKKYFHVG